MSSTFKLLPLCMSRLGTLTFTLTLAAGAAIAQPRPGDAPPDGRPGPSAEALATCKTLKSGDACQFTDARGAVSGSCWAPQGKPLACRPAGAPAPGASAPQQTPRQWNPGP